MPDGINKKIGDATRYTGTFFRELFRSEPKRAAVAVDKPLVGGEILPDKMPRHVAIIMDGNGRWAENRGLPRTAGHYEGAEALRGIIQASDDWGIEALSLYAFSTENWTRPADEVNALMGLMLKLFQSELDELHRKGACIRVLGDIEGLPGPQRDIVKRTMDRTRANTGLKLNIAINYGGRQEIMGAAKRMAARAVDRNVPIDELTEADLERELYTHGLPDVDLVIRTSGEMRISNFLIWQSTYAEMIFNPALWPDYTRLEFLKDIHQYAARDRRFGKVRHASGTGEG